MPASAAETVYGRRGGGWAPPPKKTKDAPPSGTTPGTRHVAPVGDHCAACLGPDNHTVDEAVECWDGRARMAWAKRDAGLILNHTDRVALKKCPSPTFLALGGYRPRPLGID